MARAPNLFYSGGERNPWGAFASSLGQALFGDPNEIRARESADSENAYRQKQMQLLDIEASQKQRQLDQDRQFDTLFAGGGGGAQPAAAPASPLGNAFVASPNGSTPGVIDAYSKTLDQPKTAAPMIASSEPVAPVDFPNDPGNTGGYLTRIAEAESGGNAAALTSQPGQTAGGLYGFTDPTWQGLGGAGRAVDAPVAEQTERVRALTQQNYDGLSKALGHPPTDAQLRLAHHYGLGGALKIINADPAAQLTSLFSPDVAKVNPDMTGTVGDYMTQASVDFPGSTWDGALPATPPEAMASSTPPEAMASSTPLAASPQGQDMLADASAADSYNGAFALQQPDLGIATAAGGQPDAMPSYTPPSSGDMSAGNVQVAQAAPDATAQAAPQHTLQTMWDSLTPQEQDYVQTAPDRRAAFTEIMKAKAKSGDGEDFLGNTQVERAYGYINRYQSAVVGGQKPTPEQKMNYDIAVSIVQSHPKLQQSTDPATGNPVVTMVQQDIPMMQGFVDPFGAASAPQAGAATGIPVEPAMTPDEDGVPGFTVRPIAAGKTGPMPADLAGKLAMSQAGLTDLANATAAYMPGGKVDRTLVGTAQANVPTSAGRTARQSLFRGIETIVRVASGAAVPDNEIARYQDMFMPQFLDSDAAIRAKLTAAQAWLQNMNANMQRGHGTLTKEQIDGLAAQALSGGGAQPGADPNAAAPAAPAGGGAQWKYDPATDQMVPVQ